MASIFSCTGTPGKLIATSASTVAPLAVTVDVYKLNNPVVHLTTMGLCTGLQVQQSVAAQFQNTFDDVLYVTPFGDLPGTVAISFLINPTCDTAPAPSGTVVENYFTHRLVPTTYPGGVLTRAPYVTVVIGLATPVTLKGYIIGMNFQGSVDQSVMLQGTLFMKAWKI